MRLDSSFDSLLESTASLQLRTGGKTAGQNQNSLGVQVTLAYMLAQSIAEAATGINALVDKVLELA